MFERSIAREKQISASSGRFISNFCTSEFKAEKYGKPKLYGSSAKVLNKRGRDLSTQGFSEQDHRKVIINLKTLSGRGMSCLFMNFLKIIVQSFAISPSDSVSMVTAPSPPTQPSSTPLTLAKTSKPDRNLSQFCKRNRMYLN